jgi:hypothetical protein
MTKEQLKNRTKQFALDVFKFNDKFKAVDEFQPAFKSSSSVAAIMQFVEVNLLLILNKLKVVDEEADESLFGWSL